MVDRVKLFISVNCSHDDWHMTVCNRQITIDEIKNSWTSTVAKQNSHLSGFPESGKVIR